MNTTRLLAALLLAGVGATQAATPDATAPTPTSSAAATTAQAKHHRATVHRRHVAHRHHAPHKAARTTALDRMREHAALLREAEQRRWIDAETRQGRLDGAQAALLREAAGDLEREQALLSRRGHETVDQALAMSHRQDLLDWVIRSGEVQYEPQVLRRMG